MHIFIHQMIVVNNWFNGNWYFNIIMPYLHCMHKSWHLWHFIPCQFMWRILFLYCYSYVLRWLLVLKPREKMLVTRLITADSGLFFLSAVQKGHRIINLAFELLVYYLLSTCICINILVFVQCTRISVY